MKNNSFSIVIPFGKRPELLMRAVKSIIAQTYDAWELIIVDDGTGVDMSQFEIDPRIRIFHQAHRNRCPARNLGMQNAANEWICWLDSDDAYMPTYLEILNQSINEYPEHKLYNFGSVVFHAKGTRAEQLYKDTTIREPFEHEDFAQFRSGRIASGSFVFHKSCLEDVGYLPDVTNPYAIADAAKTEFPEMIEWYGPLYMQGGKEIGNPNGDDYLMYYKLTRKFRHKVLPFYLYIQYAHL